MKTTAVHFVAVRYYLYVEEEFTCTFHNIFRQYFRPKKVADVSAK